MLAAQTERDQRMAQLTDGLERKLSAMLATQTERDRLTDQLAQNTVEVSADRFDGTELPLAPAPTICRHRDRTARAD